MAASPEKRCLYEVLGLQLDCTADEIRAAYKKLALQRHPDKLMRSGLSQAEATASFQELVNAYEVLSDPRERAWYDSHRSQILFADSNPSNSNSSVSIPNLFSYFSNSVFSGFSDTGKGFYKVYGDLFDKIYQNELNFARRLGLGAVREAPVMGNSKSPYSQVNAFYGHWLGFATVMDFVWVDQYAAQAGEPRKLRRMVEEENKKLRKKAKREYNETVRGLAAFVKKRDKRVIDMQLKRNEEMERRKEEERQKKKKLEQEKAEKAKAYKEPEWANVDDMDEESEEEVVEEGKRKKELYCVACGKKFKSEKQWRNHEQSKKHKERVAELREAFGEEERENEDASEEGEEEREENEVEGNGFVSVDDGMEELMEQFENNAGIEEQEDGGDGDQGEGESSEVEAFVDIGNGGDLEGVAEKLGLDDDETSILEAMVSGHKSRKNKKGKNKTASMEVHVEVDSDEELMLYNDRKGSRRKKGSRRQRGRRADEEAIKGDAAESSSQAEENGANEDTLNCVSVNISSQSVENNEHADSSLAEEATTHSFVETGKKNKKVSKSGGDEKNTKEANTKSKNTSKERKKKVSSNTSKSNMCEKCGEDFESRSKLHKHLNDTGHATLRSR